MSGTSEVLRSGDVNSFDGVQVFVATMFKDRAQLGERVTSWLAGRPHLKIVDMVVRQSSDDAYHCTSIILFFSTG